MFCSKCGAQNADNAPQCVQCGAILQGVSGGGPAQPPPYAQPAYAQPYMNIPNYLVQSILCTLFCCLPLGIVAIVFAAQVNGKLAAGDINGAMSASKTAKTFCWVAFGCGMVSLLIWFLSMIFMTAFHSQGGGPPFGYR